MSDVDLVVDLMKQWIILADHTKKGGPIRPKTTFDGPADRNYQLKNKLPIKFLQYEKQTAGLNIGWTNATPAPLRPSGSSAGSSGATARTRLPSATARRSPWATG